MKSNTPHPSHFQSWKAAFRKNAHLLISAGYTAARAKIMTNKHNEEHITEFIIGGRKIGCVVVIVLLGVNFIVFMKKHLCQAREVKANPGHEPIFLLNWGLA